MSFIKSLLASGGMKMKWIKHRFFVVLLVVIAFAFGISLHLVKLATYGEDWSTYPTNRKRLS